MRKMILACLVSGSLIASYAAAETILNPESRHTQYQSYGMFFDPQSELLIVTGGRGWGSVGGAAALVEFADSEWKPQLIIHASANVAYAFSDHAGGTLYTETIDARVGLAVDFQFGKDARASIIWTHQSGHIADNVPDKELIGPDLGNEMLDFRYVRDIDRHWRLGGGLRPFVITNPVIPSFGAEQFAEWYPLGANAGPHHFVPFIAVGLEEYGYQNVDVSSHFQIGVVAGDHFSGSNSHQSIRLVLGGYNGEDPRLKYFQYLHRKDKFLYVGSIFDF